MGVVLIVVIVAAVTGWLLAISLGPAAVIPPLFIAILISTMLARLGWLAVGFSCLAIGVVFLANGTPGSVSGEEWGWLALFTVTAATLVIALERQRPVPNVATGAAPPGPEMDFSSATPFDQHRELIDQLPTPSRICNADGKCLFANRAWKELTGWSDSPLSDADWLEVIHPEDREQCRSRLQDSESFSNSLRLQYRLHDRGQGPCSILEECSPIRDGQGKLIGTLCTAVDITDLLDADEETRHSEDLLRTVFYTSNLGIVLTDPKAGRYLRFNRKFCEITGYSEAELRNLTFPELTHPDDRDADWANYQRMVRGETPEYTVEKRYVRKDGRVIWVRVNCVIMRDTAGETIYDVAVIQDIDEQKQVELALKESEARFHTLATNAPAAIFVKDLDGRYALANPMTCAALGRDDVIGLTDHDLLPPELADTLRERDLQVIESGKPLESEDTILQDDVVRQFLSVKFPSVDQHGNTTGVCGVAVDVTDRVQAERRRQETEQQFQLLSNSIPQLAWMARPDGYIYWYNRRWYEYTGTTPEEMEGWGWQSVHDPRELPRVLNSYRRSIETGEAWEDTFPLRRYDGEMRWHLSRALPLKDADGQVLFWCGTNTDVSEQRRIEVTLRLLADVSESLSALVDDRSALQILTKLAVPDFADWAAADIMQTDGTIEQVAAAHSDEMQREAWENLCRENPSSKGEAIGPGAVFESHAAHLWEDLREELTRLPEDQLTSGVQCLKLLNLTSLICVPILAHRRIYGVLTFATAATGRHYTSHDLQLAEELAHRAGIALENARLYEEVRDADRRKDEFLAMLSHELRNPLAPIRSGLDVLAMERVGDPAMLQLMQQQVDHLVRLVDDLLDVSRIIRGRVELRRETVELSSLIQRAVHALQPSFDAFNQTLEVELPSEPVWLDADPVRLVQVIENLLNNASKYSESGTTVHVRVAPRGPEGVEISVRDHGLGIEPDLLPKVFDLFTQASRSLDRSQGGLGIGLTLVQRLVQMHGGTVTVHSDGIGQGSEFVIHLPTSSEDPKVSDEGDARPHRMDCRVLVVDDNIGNTRIVSVLLRKLGVGSIDVAHDGKSALERFASIRPDLVLLDIGLPGINGYEVGRRIRSDLSGDDAMIVALTGYGQEEDRRRSREMGFDEHLVKPISLAQLEWILAHPKLNPDQVSETEA